MSQRRGRVARWAVAAIFLLLLIDFVALALRQRLLRAELDLARADFAAGNHASGESSAFAPGEALDQ